MRSWMWRPWDLFNTPLHNRSFRQSFSNFRHRVLDLPAYLQVAVAFPAFRRRTTARTTTAGEETVTTRRARALEQATQLDTGTAFVVLNKFP